MILGGPVFGDVSTPELWVAALQAQGYSAAYCPLSADADDALVAAYAEAAASAGIVIAEVGAWSNPMSQDCATRRSAITYCQGQLALADRIGARCCVNIAGSCGDVWDGPHPDNLTEDTFELVVTTTREIIDAVRPTHTYYGLETMPWMYPNSAESYLRLLRAVDRDRFAVHLDPVNLVASPETYFSNGALIRRCFALLGPFIKSCHAKDIALANRLTIHLDEVRPGLGGLDYPAYLRELDKLPADTPLMLEHLAAEQEYAAAARHIRTVAAATAAMV